MRSAIVYYSFSGNTHRIAKLLEDILKGRGDEVIPVRVRPLKEVANFFTQCIEAFLGRKPDLYRTLLDLSAFDRIIIGSPVWAFRPAPAINAYINKCSSLNGKDAICFVTYGSGAGKNKTLEAMKKVLEEKGAESVKTVSFQQDQPREECKNEFLKLLTPPC